MTRKRVFERNERRWNPSSQSSFVELRSRPCRRRVAKFWWLKAINKFSWNNSGLLPSGSGREPQQVGGQATKGTRWMPWRQEAMKDVVSYEKLRGVASRRRSGDIRMKKPSRGHSLLSPG